MPTSSSTPVRRRVTAGALAATVAVAAGGPALASAAPPRPRIRSVDAAILVGDGLPPNPYVTVKTQAGSTSSVAVFWMGKRTDLGQSPSESTAAATAWTAPLPGIRKGQRMRLQITASGPRGTATTARTVRFAWRNALGR